ncbi:type II toxin-antitoxin system RatA family toxin [Nitrolancea hollandica]|uniref:Cyclase/dehydrase n=1 Tax=Nitrolancea hollandica Lb TaxID=1129897 RepID=I4EHK1_9BACT|nr:SRPBCC family protein [Nitrolancea hollandica]CCF84163.1 Cyclase/dehydrase [Nitrolancea hollandica Lb]
MHRINRVDINGELDQVYRLGAEIERWPLILPHYRGVDLLWRQDNAVIARMRATRSGIPVSWTCVQQRFPSEPRATFRHIAGFTAGMEVTWQFTTLADGRIRVEIIHDFRKGWPLVDRLVSDRVVGDFFVANIADKTLARIKVLAETACPRVSGPVMPAQPAAIPAEPRR